MEKARVLYTDENGKLLQNTHYAQYTVYIEGQLWERQGREGGRRSRGEVGRIGREEREGGKGRGRDREERQEREAERRGREERQGGEVERREALGHTGHIIIHEYAIHTYSSVCPTEFTVACNRAVSSTHIIPDTLAATGVQEGVQSGKALLPGAQI